MRSEAIGQYAAIALLLECQGTPGEAAESQAGSSMTTTDFARYLVPIDLHFTKPTKPMEGVPLGNGKMGTLVWIDGSGSKLQFNFGRPDVFYVGSATSTWSNKGHTDGNSKVGHVDIGFQGSPFASTCNQDLHAYAGYESVQGADVSARIVPWVRS